MRMSTKIWVFLALFNCLNSIKGWASPCGKTYVGNSGVLKTPNYPQNYPDNADCTWKIMVPKDHTVRLVFLHFVIERSPHCFNDYVKVFNGGNDRSTMLGVYCGGMRPFHVPGTTSMMTVKFRSDSSMSYHGFRAKFVAVPKSGIIPTLPTDPPTTATPTTPSTRPSTRPSTALITTIATTLPTTKPTTQPTISISFAKPFKNVTICLSKRSCKLICQIRGMKKAFPVIQWSKSNKLLKYDKYDTPGIEVIRKNKKRSILVIKQANQIDSGWYGCHATDPVTLKVISMYGRVEVRDSKLALPTRGPSPPSIFMANINASVNVSEKAVLFCKANGSQPLNIRWMTFDAPKDVHGQSIDTQHRKYSDSIFTIELDEAPLVVKVRCIAENQYGRAIKEGFIHVRDGDGFQEEKSVMITMAALNLSAKVNEDVILRCAANGSAPVSMRWLIDNRYYKGKQSRFKDNYTSYYLLTVKKKTTVKCEAQNPYGIVSRTGVVTIHSDIAARKAGPWDSFQPGNRMFYIVIGCAAFLALLFVASIVCFRKKVKNRKYKVPAPISLEQLTSNPMFERTENAYVNPSIEKLNVHRNNIEFIKDIENGEFKEFFKNEVYYTMNLASSEGAFSRLFLGKITHSSRTEQDALVHVKVLKESTPLETNKDDFQEEALDLTTYEHPNVQSLVGVCATGRPLCLIFECSDRGDLNQFLRDSGCSHYIIRERPNSPLETDTKISKLDQLCIAKQIAAGMQYLFDKGYSHRLLCTKNCLISKNMAVKIANIGLRNTRPSTSYGILDPIEKSLYPVRWLPFESVTTGLFTDTTDVWSFGIVLWEIYSNGMTPYYGMNNDEVIALVREGDILPLPKECPREMYDLMQDCWNLVPHERPSFRFLHEKISALVTGVAV